MRWSAPSCSETLRCKYVIFISSYKQSPLWWPWIICQFNCIHIWASDLSFSYMNDLSSSAILPRENKPHLSESHLWIEWWFKFGLIFPSCPLIHFDMESEQEVNLIKEITQVTTVIVIKSCRRNQGFVGCVLKWR